MRDPGGTGRRACSRKSDPGGRVRGSGSSLLLTGITGVLLGGAPHLFSHVFSFKKRPKKNAPRARLRRRPSFKCDVMVIA